MAFYLNGIHVPHRKNTQKQPVSVFDSPKTVTIPMSMHVGKPAIPVVKAGDSVMVGTKIGEADGRISSPVYSSVSGTVSKICDYLLSDGKTGTAIVIESDGNMTKDENVCQPTVNSNPEYPQFMISSAAENLVHFE